MIGPASRRQVPDNLKLTFPLMVIQNGDRYLGLTWQMRPASVPVRFTGPAVRLRRTSDGLVVPGSNGKNRVEGSLLPRESEVLRAGQTVTLRATLLGGLGHTVVPAVQQYVALRGLPARPAERTWTIM